MNYFHNVFDFGVRIGPTSVFAENKLHHTIDGAEIVIQVRNVNMKYGYWRHHVLQEIYMNVYKGTIYCLIGPSGSGKSTLLNCIAHTLTIDKGVINVFGSLAGNKLYSYRIGYMPQELGLYDNLTIKEVALMFGRIGFMPKQEIINRLRFFKAFFELSDFDSKLKHLSFGERRRVSFVVAIIHDPDLIILDEPTVGSDSVIRDVMWQYLLMLVENLNKTVLLTTHYLEESSNAHNVGIMNNGKILDQGRPSDLLRDYGAKGMKDVYLKIVREEIKIQYEVVNEGEGAPKSLSFMRLTTKRRIRFGSLIPSFVPYVERRMAAGCSMLVMRHLTVIIQYMLFIMIRDNYLIFFTAIFPIIISVIIGIFNKSSELPVFAIVNDENGYRGPDYKSCRISPYDCDNNDLGCWLTDSLKKFAKILPVADTSQAKLKLWQQKVDGVVHIKKDFSKRYFEALSKSGFDEVGSDSMVDIFVHTEGSIYNMLPHMALSTMSQNFFFEIMSLCKIKKKLNYFPHIIQVTNLEEEAKQGHNYNVFPGLILCLIYILQITITTTTYTTSRRRGYFQRLYVAGIYPCQLVLMYTMLHAILSIIQAIIIVVLPVLFFNMDGDVWCMILIVSLVSISANSVGLLISAFCTYDATAVRVMITVTLLVILFSGVYYPISEMPYILKIFAYCMPLGNSITTLRIVRMGKLPYKISSYMTYGLITPLLWIIFGTSLNVLVFWFKGSGKF